MNFQKATKKQSRARVGLVGPAGSGKTYTSLIIASILGQKVAVVDSEHGSASKYADQFEFDVLELDSFHPDKYIEAIHTAETSEYDVVILDSISHAWMGKDGILENVDRITSRSKSGNAYTTGWRDMTPKHNELIDAMISCKIHLIATMRAKTEYVMEKNANGKSVPRKVGMAPVQRDGMEYEFDIVGDLDWDNNLVITKSRCTALSGQVIQRPGKDFAMTIKNWLTDGVPIVSSDKIDELRTLGNEVRPLLTENEKSTLRDVLSGCTEQVYAEWKTKLTEKKNNPDPIKQVDKIRADMMQVDPKGWETICNNLGLLIDTPATAMTGEALQKVLAAASANNQNGGSAQ